MCSAPLCAECRLGSRHAPLCAEHEDVPVIQGWAEVARAHDEVRASLLADRLRAADIEAAILSQKDRWHVVTFGGLSVVRVLVPAARWADARDVLEAAPDARTDGPVPLDAG